MKRIKIELVIYQVEVVWPMNSRLKTRMTVYDYTGGTLSAKPLSAKKTT